MNEKPHVHELEFYSDYEGEKVFYKLFSPDPKRARGIKYGDQIRRWPQLNDFSKKIRKHWWNKPIESRSLEQREQLLHQAREEAIREIVATHDKQSIVAGERDKERQALVDQYTTVVNETALKPWQKELTK